MKLLKYLIKISIHVFQFFTHDADFGNDSFEIVSGENRKSFCCFISALAFKNAKQFDQAKDACLREAVAHENNRAYLFQPLKRI